MRFPGISAVSRAGRTVPTPTEVSNANRPSSVPSRHVADERMFSGSYASTISTPSPVCGVSVEGRQKEQSAQKPVQELGWPPSLASIGRERSCASPNFVPAARRPESTLCGRSSAKDRGPAHTNPTVAFRYTPSSSESPRGRSSGGRFSRGASRARAHGLG
jgi:hypothetical protein